MDWLRKAIKDAGGFKVVAAASGISEPHLYSLCRRPGQAGYRPMSLTAAKKLAPVLPRVGKARWKDAVLRDLFSTNRPEATGAAS